MARLSDGRRHFCSSKVLKEADVFLNRKCISKSFVFHIEAVLLRESSVPGLQDEWLLVTLKKRENVTFENRIQ